MLMHVSRAHELSGLLRTFGEVCHRESRNTSASIEDAKNMVRLCRVAMEIFNAEGLNVKGPIDATHLVEQGVFLCDPLLLNHVKPELLARQSGSLFPLNNVHVKGSSICFLSHG